MGLGVYSDRQIREFINQGWIKSSSKITKEQIQPSSLDLKLGGEAYCMRCSAIPGIPINKYLKENKKHRFSLGGRDGGINYKGFVHIVELNESLNLPDYISARANPKSSIGRVDAHVRLLTEKGIYFDDVRSGYKGKLFLEIYPRSFDLVLRENDSLNQIRFMDYGCAPLNSNQISTLDKISKTGLIVDKNNKRIKLNGKLEKDLLILTSNLNQSPSSLIARNNTREIDFSKRDLPLSRYFDPEQKEDEMLIIDWNSFYLLSTDEYTIIPPDHCAEMIDIDTSSGEYRAHYAGFFDPGFEGEGVLEVRNNGAPFGITHGKNITSLRFFPMKEIPERLYGKEIGSHYHGQRGIRPAKFFDVNK